MENLAMTENKLYWPGSVAKFSIANQIYKIVKASDGPIIAADLGAGMGGDWPKLVEDLPNLTIHLWEPHTPTANALAKLVPSNRFQVHEDLSEMNGIADIGTSLSVLEHVRHIEEHFRQADKVLKPGGKFFMNFDDGHFRHEVKNIYAPSDFVLPLKESLRTIISKFFPTLIPVNKYQKRVLYKDFKSACANSSLILYKIECSQLPSIKGVAKLFKKSENQLPFLNSWLDFETEIQNLIRQEHGAKAEEIIWNLLPARTAIFSKSK
jgi:SAM-dependent methyltransferase